MIYYLLSIKTYWCQAYTVDRSASMIFMDEVNLNHNEQLVLLADKSPHCHKPF